MYELCFVKKTVTCLLICHQLLFLIPIIVLFKKDSNQSIPTNQFETRAASVNLGVTLEFAHFLFLRLWTNFFKGFISGPNHVTCWVLSPD